MNSNEHVQDIFQTKTNILLKRKGTGYLGYFFLHVTLPF